MTEIRLTSRLAPCRSKAFADGRLIGEVADDVVAREFRFDDAE